VPGLGGADASRLAAGLGDLPLALAQVCGICPRCRVALAGVLSAQVDFMSASDWRLPYWMAQSHDDVAIDGK
jgi:hypothetical protein